MLTKWIKYGKVFVLYKEVGDNMDKDFICDMLDCYEDLLTDNQKQVMNDYYRYDVNLAEIAELMGISKQGVKDTKDKALSNLLNFESVMKFAEKKREWYTLRTMEEDVKVLKDFVDSIFY